METQEDLECSLNQFFSGLLHETEEDKGLDIDKIKINIPCLVSVENNMMLMHRIEMDEVEEEVKHMERGRTPGSDGFTTNFFQSC